mmetsp:Transcript_23379/g.67658  ORF Transcript_23379/g.67658 Transcript_23379/m.67658 type:complete len:345 (+) Transcript_23379:191-1225(+)
MGARRHEGSRAGGLACSPPLFVTGGEFRRPRGQGLDAVDRPLRSVASVAANVRAGGEEGMAQQVIGSRASPLVAHDAAADEVAARLRDMEWERRRRLAAGDETHEGRDVVGSQVTPRPFRSDHLDPGAPEAPDVGLATEAVGRSDDLGRRPSNGAGRGAEKVHGGDAALPAMPEVRELRGHALAEQHIVGPQVPVYHRRRVLVQVVQALQDAPQGLQQRLAGKGSGVAHHGSKGTAGDELKENVEVEVSVLMPQVLDQVLVLQPAALFEVGVYLLPLAAQRQLRHSDGEGLGAAPAVYGLGLVHGPEAARSQLAAADPGEALLRSGVPVVSEASHRPWPRLPAA